MGAAKEHRGCAVLIRPFQQAIDDANWIDESLRLLAAADAAVEYVRDARASLAAIQSGKGIAATQKRAHLNCHIGQSRLGKLVAAEAAWRDAVGQRSIAFRALDMRTAAKFLMEWIP